MSLIERPPTPKWAPVNIQAFEEELAVNTKRRRSRGRLLLVSGLLGLLGAAFICAVPELGIASAVGGALAGLGSAGVTLLARR